MSRPLLTLVGVASGLLLVIAIALRPPSEVMHIAQVTPATDAGNAAVAAAQEKLTAEMGLLRQLLSQQQKAASEQTALMDRLQKAVAASPAAAPASSARSPATSATAPSGLAAGVAAAEQHALGRCTEADVPILKILRSPCPDGMHGYGCTDRWDLLEQFLPTPSLWLKDWNASQHVPAPTQPAHAPTRPARPARPARPHVPAARTPPQPRR